MTLRWVAIKPAPGEGRIGGQLLRFREGVALFGGSQDPRQSHATSPPLLYYSLNTERWAAIHTPPTIVREGAAASVIDRSLFVWNRLDEDRDRRHSYADGAIYTNSDQWVEVPRAPLTPRVYPFITVDEGRLIVWGGNSLAGQREFRDGAIFDMRESRWTALPEFPELDGYTQSVMRVGRYLMVIVGASIEPTVSGSKVGKAVARVAGQRRAVAHSVAAYDIPKNKWTLGPVPRVDIGVSVCVAFGDRVLCAHPTGETGMWDTTSGEYDSAASLPGGQAFFRKLVAFGRTRRLGVALSAFEGDVTCWTHDVVTPNSGWRTAPAPPLTGKLGVLSSSDDDSLILLGGAAESARGWRLHTDGAALVGV